MQKTALPRRSDSEGVALCDRNTVVSNLHRVKKSPQQFRFITKTLLVMKLTLIFLIAGLLTAHAESYAQTVTFKGRNVAITKVFQEIEKQTGYTVFANKDLLKTVKPVSLSVENMPLNDFLTMVLQNQPVGYEIHNRTIFITNPAAM